MKDPSGSFHIKCRLDSMFKVKGKGDVARFEGPCAALQSSQSDNPRMNYLNFCCIPAGVLVRPKGQTSKSRCQCVPDHSQDMNVTGHNIIDHYHDE